MKDEANVVGADACPNCGGTLVVEAYKHLEHVGKWKVSDGTGMRPKCQACGRVYLTLDDLAAYQMRAAKTAILDRKHEGAVLRYARKAIGLTQKELALLLGYAPEEVSRWENDNKPAQQATVMAIVALLMRVLDDGEDPRAMVVAMASPPTVTSEGLSLIVPMRKVG